MATRRRVLLAFINAIQIEPSIPNNEIWYTSSDGNIVTPKYTDVFGANIVSNTYVSGQGTISFDVPVTTIGKQAFKECSNLTSVIIPNNVTTLGYEAFYGCESLTSVNIGDGVTEIGGWAFQDCSNLTSVNIGNSVKTIVEGAFDWCTSLTSVTIPDSVTTIGNWAFHYCGNLTSIYCKAITPPTLGGAFVFDNNGSGRKIYVPAESVDAYKSATYWSEYADYIVGYDFENDSEVEDGGDSGDSGGTTTGSTYTVNLNGEWEATTAISNPDSTLYDGVYRSSSNYNVGSGVSTMYIDISGYSEFTLYVRSFAESNYDYVMVSQLDKTITGSSTYSDTTLVKAHTRGNQKSGTTISDYTEVKYTNIEGGSHRITILYRKDSSVNRDDDRGYVLISKSNGGGDIETDTTYSIQYTSSDGNIVTPYNTNNFGANIASNNYINGQGIISFDSSVTAIGDYSFYNCDSLTSVTIPDGVTTIGGNAFRDCDSLTSIIIPNSVTKIGVAAFQSCDSLTSVTIGDSVSRIEQAAFYNCTNMTNVYCKAATPPSLGGSSTFQPYINDRKVYVPVGSVDAYKNAVGWNEFADTIVGYDFDVNLITFTIDGTEYQAEEGMTWSEWVNSEYNINGKFFIDFSDLICDGDSLYFIGTEENYVYVSDIIQENYNYWLVG